MSSERIKIPDEIVAALRQPLPREAIKPHPTKPYLSTIKTIYSIERLNEVFGMNGWFDHYEVVNIGEPKPYEKTVNGQSKTLYTSPMVVVKGELTIPEYGIRREAFGGHDNEDLGDAYKGACTDALSKMVSALYIGMDVYKGNPNTPATPPKAAKPAATPSATPAVPNEPVVPSGDFLYDNGIMECQVLDAKHFPAKDGKKETCVLAVNSPKELPNKLTCFHTSLVPALLTIKKGERVILDVKQAVKDGKTYLNIQDVRYIGTQAYLEGKSLADPTMIQESDEVF
jgi:hypothetical protein